MSNEPLGLYEELRARNKRFEDREQERKRMLSLGPAWNGAYSQPDNPFRGAIPLRLKQGGFHARKIGHRDAHPEARLGINVSQVVQAVCIESGLRHGDLFSDHRIHRLVRPRQVCMWAISRYCPEYSLPEIAYLFKRDHTTVMHGIRATDERLKQQHEETSALVANVRLRLATLAQAR